MHRILYIICTLLAIAAFACGEAHYDSRLTAIDSIIEDSPDSALAELRALDYESLSGSDNRAYYALLLTQARYKSYDSIPSTDTIEIAVAQFTSNGDREKLTRSLIYKGATLEELGKPVEAMEQYKLAEETAAPTDYHNLGYTNFRMANLYHNAYAESELHIEKYKRAYHYYTLANDSIYQLKCLSNLCQLYRAYDTDSAIFYNSQTLMLARELNDKPTEMSNYYLLLGLYYKDRQYRKMIPIAKTLLDKGNQYINQNNCYNYLCRAYSMLNMTDSAEHFFSLITCGNSEDDLLSQLITNRDLAMCHQNHELAMQFNKSADSLAKSIELQSPRKELLLTELSLDRQKENATLSKLEAGKLLIFILLTMLLFTIAISIIMLISYKHRHIQFLNLLSKQKAIALEKEKYSLSIFIEQLNDLLDINVKYGSRLEKFYDNFLSILQNGEMNKTIINAIRNYADTKHNGIIPKLISQFPKLKDSDIDFLCMEIAELDPDMISFLMGFSNSRSFYRRKKLIQDKIGFNNISIQELCEAVLKN